MVGSSTQHLRNVFDTQFECFYDITVFSM